MTTDSTPFAIARRTWSDDKEHINDIAIDDDGRLVMALGKEAYEQTVEAVIKTLLGELPLDTERGVNYADTVWTNTRLLGDWRGYVIDSVNALPFVKDITDFAISVESDRFGKGGAAVKYRLVAETDIGDIEVSNKEES